MKSVRDMNSRLFRSLVEAVEFMCALVYSAFLPVMCKKPRRVVIYYHGIKEHQVEGFERQMRYLADCCRVVKATEIGGIKDSGKKMIVAVTFDDAFESVAENALPILEKLSLPATVFVPVGNMGTRPRWPVEKDFYPNDDDERVMDEKQIAAFSGDGFEFCSHTVSHRPLTELKYEQMEYELAESKRILRSITSGKVPAVSYPFGACSESVCEAAKQTGYELGFTIEPRMVDFSPGVFQTGRFKVSPDDGLTKFKLKVSGAYQVSKYLRRAKAMFLGRQTSGDKRVEGIQDYY